MILTTKLIAKIKRLDLSIAEAAQAIGVSQSSLRAILNEESLPNARSTAKYAKFLGISAGRLNTAIEKQRQRRQSTATLPLKASKKLSVADQRMLASLKASLTSLDQLRSKIQTAIRDFEA